MANEKAVSDEAIAAALIETGSQRAAAEQLHINEKTIYNRLSDGEFIAVYENAKNEILRNAVSEVNRQLSEALNTVSEIMKDKNNAAGTRLQAAKTIIENATKLADVLKENEKDVSAQIRSNKDPISKMLDGF